MFYLLVFASAKLSANLAYDCLIELLDFVYKLNSIPKAYSSSNSGYSKEHFIGEVCP